MALYFAITGEIYRISPTRALLKDGGLVFDIAISMQTYEQILKMPKDSVFLFLHEIIREDFHALVGFANESERDLFVRLLKISGVGMKVALAILSTYSSSKLLNIIQAGDARSLTKVPGIGARSATKIMADLIGYLNLESDTQTMSANEAREALASLGFKDSQISDVFLNLDLSEDTASIVKLALKALR